MGGLPYGVFPDKGVLLAGFCPCGSVPSSVYAALSAIRAELFFDPAAVGPQTYYRSISATSPGSAAVSRAVQGYRGMAATGAGSASLARSYQASVSMAAQGTGTGTLTRVALYSRLLGVISVASLGVTKGVTKAISAVAQGIPAVTTKLTLGILLSGAQGLGIAGLSKILYEAEVVKFGLKALMTRRRRKPTKPR
jgi:hypothetical protein